MNLKEKADALREQVEGFAILAKSGSLTSEQHLAFEKAVSELEQIEKQLEISEKADAITKRLRAPITPSLPAPTGSESSDYTSKAVAYSRGVQLKGWEGSNKIEMAKSAYGAGMWLLSVVSPKSEVGQKAAKWCIENGITKSMYERDNETGGFLVPMVLSNSIIDLRNEYGVIRKLVNVVPMTSDTLLIPRRAGGLTTYWVGEGATITASDLSFDQVQLVAKKLVALSIMSSELNEDAVISFAQRIADEIAYAFAKAEDDAGFNGDGTSTYGGIVGFNAKLKGLSGTIANIAGLVVGTGNAYSELVLGDFRQVIAKCPTYAKARARWVVSPSFYYNTMLGAAQAAAGLTATEVIQGQEQFRFLGYPVTLAEQQPTTEANSQVCALFGDFALAATMGDRRRVTLMTSEHDRFTTDELTIRGTERVDIDVHDVGNASSSAGSRVPGPVVGLITAAS